MSMSIRIPSWMIRASNWLDNNIFTDRKSVPVVSDRVAIQQQIEREANQIRRRIAKSITLADTDTVIHLICRYIRDHRHSGQNNMLKGCVGSLMLELENKKHELLSKL